jgi:hypothetical protein
VLALACQAVALAHLQGDAQERLISLSLERYRPNDGTARDIYGDALLTTVTYEFVTGKGGGLRLGVGLLRESGDGYDRYFIGGPRAHQTLLPVEASANIRIATGTSHAFVAGVGLQLLAFWERYPGLPRASGQDLGPILYFGPELHVSRSFRVGLEYRYMNADLFDESSADRYNVDLTGSLFRVAVRYVY